MKTITQFAAAMAAAATPVAADAATYLFTLTGPASGYSASWTLDSNPTPDTFNPDQGFAIERVTGTFPGSTLGAAYLDFFSAVNGGGLSISDADGPALLATLSGAQLYTGSESAPTLLLGAFSLTDIDGLGGYSLAVAAVPDAGTWAMLILGFGLVGGTMRVRRVAVRFA